MSDWRYWITYTGVVTAADKHAAEVAAVEDHAHPASWLTTLDVEVEEVGEGE